VFDEVAVEGGFMRRVEREPEFPGDETDRGGAVDVQCAVVALDEVFCGVVDLADEFFEHVFEAWPDFGTIASAPATIASTASNSSAKAEWSTRRGGAGRAVEPHAQLQPSSPGR
jgi:hypothetical protein